jgi:transcription-repair coupling factor (superfamily II helicase)
MTALIADAAATERMRQLYRRLFEWEGCEECVAALMSGNPATFDGVWGSSCALVAAALHDRAGGPLVVVCPTQNEADELAADLRLFSSQPVEQFPAWETALGEGVIEDEAHGQRLRQLKRLREPAGSPLIVTSIQALLQPVPSPAEIAASTRVLRTGQQVDLASCPAGSSSGGFIRRVPSSCPANSHIAAVFSTCSPPTGRSRCGSSSLAMRSSRSGNSTWPASGAWNGSMESRSRRLVSSRFQVQSSRLDGACEL